MNNKFIEIGLWLASAAVVTGVGVALLVVTTRLWKTRGYLSPASGYLSLSRRQATFLLVLLLIVGGVVSLLGILMFLTGVVAFLTTLLQLL